MSSAIGSVLIEPSWESGHQAGSTSKQLGWAADSIAGVIDNVRQSKQTADLFSVAVWCPADKVGEVLAVFHSRQCGKGVQHYTLLPGPDCTGPVRREVLVGLFGRCSAQSKDTTWAQLTTAAPGESHSHLARMWCDPVSSASPLSAVYPSVYGFWTEVSREVVDKCQVSVTGTC